MRTPQQLLHQSRMIAAKDKILNRIHVSLIYSRVSTIWSDSIKSDPIIHSFVLRIYVTPFQENYSEALTSTTKKKETSIMHLCFLNAFWPMTSRNMIHRNTAHMLQNEH